MGDSIGDLSKLDKTDFENNLDNSDLQLRNTGKDIAAGYDSLEEAKAYKLYLETLKLESEIKSGGKKMKIKDPFDKDGKKEYEVDVADLVGIDSQFENCRRLVLIKLNKMTKLELKQMLADFESSGVMDLSSKISNFLVDKHRRDQANTKFLTSTYEFDGLAKPAAP